MEKKTQESMLLDHFLAGGRITQLEASIKYGIGRLASRICDLKQEGYLIVSAFVDVKKANGEEASVKEYWMEPGKYAHKYETCVKLENGFIRVMQEEDLTVRAIWMDGKEMARKQARRILTAAELATFVMAAYEEE